MLRLWHWVWNNLIAPFPDIVPGQFELRDLANVAIGGLGVVLTVMAFILGPRQLRMQAKEHDRWLAEQTKFMDLRPTAPSQRPNPNPTNFGGVDVPHRLIVTLRVLNGGDKTADGFYWEALIPRDLYAAVKFCDENGDDVEMRVCRLSTADEDTFDKVDGHYPHKLFPYSAAPVAYLAVQNTFPRTAEFWIKWRISCEDGGEPKKGGHAKIHFQRVAGTYATFEPDPNADQDVVPDKIVYQGGAP
jgi:hypothetical protein